MHSLLLPLLSTTTPVLLGTTVCLVKKRYFLVSFTDMVANERCRLKGLAGDSRKVL